MKQPPNVQLPPASLEEVYVVVTAAASQDPGEIKEATDRLNDVLERPGSLDCLHEIAAQKTVALLVRQQSIIQFKNNITHWRSRRYLSEENRVKIRARSWAYLDEEDDIIFNCHKVIMGKVARTDYPSNWQSLLPDLIGIINGCFESCYGILGNENPPILRLRRSLQLLNAIIKELATLKLGSGIQTFNSITEQLHMILFNYYSSLSSILSASLTPATLGLPRTTNDISISHLVYKCLVKLSSWLWQRIEHDDFAKYQQWFQDFFKSSAFQAQSLFEQRVNITTSLLSPGIPADLGVISSVKNLNRHVRVFGKFFRRIQVLNNKQFVLLPMCTDIIMYYWSKVVQSTTVNPDFINDSDTAVFPIRFLVQAMVLFRESLAQWTPVRRDGTPNENALKQEFIDDAVKVLVTRFIPLTQSDLEKWMADPEEWVNREEHENEFWEYELRPCAGRVLLTLSSQYKEYVSVLLQGTFDEVIGRTAVELPDIIAKEAIYCAVGKCSIRLRDVIPFEQCLEQTFVAEAQNPNPSYPIIKRRIAWLIGKWVSDECYPAHNRKIWEILVYLLQDHGGIGTDIAVRLSASTALHECVETLVYDVRSFDPFIATVVPELLRLISEVDTLEGKGRVVNCLNIVIDRSETRIVPFVDAIAQQIPQLWSTAGDGGEGWILKGILVHTVKSTLTACKESSARLVDLVVPLVRECITPPSSLHLDKDGILLWLAALRNSGSLVQDQNGPSGLFSLLPLLVTILSNNVDLLASITDIAISYFLLDGAYVLHLCAVDFFSAYNQVLGNAIAANTKELIVSLNLLLQLTPASLWGEPLHISGLFSILLDTFLEDKMSAILLTEYIHVFSRIALGDSQIFLQLMSATAASKDISETQLWEVLLDQWWTRFDNMSEPKHRKLTAMGLANLVSTGRPEVLNRLPNEIANLWLDVFGEVKEQERRPNDGGSSPELSLYWDQPFGVMHSDIEGTPEYVRRSIAFDNDPVRTTRLVSFIKARLHEAEVACGGSDVFQRQYLSKIDPAVLTQIEAEINRDENQA